MAVAVWRSKIGAWSSAPGVRHCSWSVITSRRCEFGMHSGCVKCSVNSVCWTGCHLGSPNKLKRFQCFGIVLSREPVHTFWRACHSGASTIESLKLIFSSQWWTAISIRRIFDSKGFDYEAIIVKFSFLNRLLNLIRRTFRNVRMLLVFTKSSRDSLAEQVAWTWFSSFLNSVYHSA